MNNTQLIYKQLLENYFKGQEATNDDIIKDIEDSEQISDEKYYRLTMAISLQYVTSKTLGDVHGIEKIPFYSMLKRFQAMIDSFSFIDDYKMTFMVFSPAACINMTRDYDIPAVESFAYLKDDELNDRQKVSSHVSKAVENYLKYANDTDNIICVSIGVTFNRTADCSFNSLLHDMKNLREFILMFNRYGRLTGLAPKSPECKFADREKNNNEFQFSNIVWKFLLNSDVERIGNFIYDSKKFSVQKNRDEEVHTMFPRAIYNFINKMIDTFGPENIDVTGLRAESIGNKIFEVVFHLINVKKEDYTMLSVIEAIRFNIDELSRTDKLALLDCYNSMNIWMKCDDIPKEKSKVPCETMITDDFIPYTVKFVDDSSQARKYKYASKTNPQKDECSIHGKAIKNLENLYLKHKKDVERYIKK